MNNCTQNFTDLLINSKLARKAIHDLCGLILNWVINRHVVESPVLHERGKFLIKFKYFPFWRKKTGLLPSRRGDIKLVRNETSGLRQINQSGI